ncbi:MAG: transposase, IS605 OrfB family, central region [uncultured archaeon A07HR60]|nr:MAG: transposase, IS605 OrfB family, central region [uncultured archaeon A07HR60]
MQLTEQFHIPDQYHEDCDRLTQLVRKHSQRLLEEEYWSDSHVKGIGRHSGTAYTYIRDDQYDCFENVDEYLYSRFKRCVYQRITSTLLSHNDEHQAFRFVVETVPEQKIEGVGWGELRNHLFREDSSYVEWGILESVVEQLNNYFDMHGRFPECYTELVSCPEPNGTLPYSADAGDYQIHKLSDKDGKIVFTMNAPDSLDTDSYHDWTNHDIEFSHHSRFAELSRRGEVGAPTLHKSEHGYTLDLPVSVPEIETETADDRVLSVDLGVKKQVTAVVIDDTEGQVAPPQFINHKSKQKLFRLATEADGINDRLGNLRRNGKSHTDRFAHLYNEYHHLRQKEKRLREQIQHDAANQLVWMAAKHDCGTIVFESLGQIEAPDASGSLARSISTWARGSLLDKTEYKAELVDIETDMVNPWGTSRHCPRCGDRGKTVKAPDDHTKCRHGGHFYCPNCEYECDRDVVGAVTVGRKHLSQSTMEEAAPVAYTETGTHASFPSSGIDARSTGVQSTAELQDEASGRQTRLTQDCSTACRGESDTGGLQHNQGSNTDRQLSSGSVRQCVLASTPDSG